MVERTGLSDFLKLWGNLSPFAVLAVKAKASFVSSALADTYELQDLVSDAGRRTAQSCPNPDEWASVVQLRDDSWTYVLWAFGIVSPGSQGGLFQMAQDLTSTLETEAFALIARASVLWDALEEPEDGPYSLYRYFKDGENVETAVFSSHGQVLRFEPEAEGAEPPAAGDDLEILDRLWQSKGLYLPACAPDVDGERRVLAVAEIDPGRVAHADLLEANLSLPAEEDTLDMLLDDRRRIEMAPAPAAGPDPEDDDETAPLGPLGRFGRWMGGVLGRR